MMPYWVRVLLGALLGLAGAVALWLFVGIAWLTASVAALLAAAGFLGSYFIWSADRLAEGYEQVLFDRPNTIVTVVLVLAFAGAGVGTGLLGGASVEPMSPADRMSALYVGYQNAADAFTSKETDADATNATMADLRAESDRIAAELDAMPEGDDRDALVAANDALALAMDSMQACAAGDKAQCRDARLMAADAKAALDKAVPPPPSDEAEAVAAA